MKEYSKVFNSEIKVKDKNFSKIFAHREWIFNCTSVGRGAFTNNLFSGNPGAVCTSKE